MDNLLEQGTNQGQSDELLQKVLQRFLDLVGCEIGSICLLNEQTNELEFQYAIGKERFHSVPLGKGLIGTAAQLGKPVRVGNVAKDPRYVMHVRETRSELDVPLLIDGELIGVLNAESGRLDAFSQKEEDIAVIFADLAAIAIENAKLFKRLKKESAEQIEAIREIGFGITAGLDLKEILNDSLQKTLHLIKEASVGEIWLLDEETGKLRVQATQGDAVAKVWELSIGEGIIGWVAKSRRSYLVGNVEEDARFVRRLARTQSELAVPMFKGDQLIGVFNVEHPQLNAFVREDIPLFEAIASQVVIAIDNARLYDRLDTLAKVGQAATSTLDLDEVLDRILEESLEALGANYGTLRLLERSTGELMLRAHRGEVGDRTHESIQLGQGITGWVAQHGEPLLVGDVLEEPRYLEYLAGTRCELAVPIKVEDRTIGVLNAEHPQPYAFDEHDMHLLEAIASQAAMIVRNARLYEARQTVNEVGQALTSGIRLREDEILELIRDQASRLMDTDNMYIALYDEATDTVRFGLAFVDGRRVDVETEEGWQPRRAGKGKTEEIIRTKMPLFHATKAEAEEWYAQPGHEEYMGKALPSWLGVPMMVGEKVLGVIAAYHPTQDYVYSSDDLEILQAMANQAAIALDNAHMFYDVNRGLESLARFGQVITSSIRLREDEVLELIYTQASRLMDTDNMYIALYDEVTDTVRFGLAFVDGKRIDVATEEGWQPRRAGKGKTEEIIHTKRPLFHATKAEAEAWYAQPEHAEYIGDTFASWLGVPMMVGERVLGVIATYHPTRDHVYSGDDLTILQAMANQAAIALDNAHMFYDVNQRLEALVEFGQAVASGLRLREDEILELIHDHASRLMDTDNMYIALYDEVTDTVRFGLAFVNGRQVGVETEEVWQPRKAGKGRTEYIIRASEPLFFATKAEAEAWYAQPEHEEYTGTGIWPSWLGVPMMVGERVLGVIATYHPTRDQVYSGDDLAILQAMANQAAIAIDNARLGQALEQEASEQKWAALGRVSAGVAHRVGNKAGIVRVKVKELYNMVPRDEAIIANLEALERNNQYLLDLAELLLRPAKAASEVLEPLDINIILRDARKKADIPPGIKVKMDLAKDLPEVIANYWFVEVFVELITNAVRAMEKSPKKMLEICSRRATDNWVEVLVKDTGCGIPPTLRDKMFELFFVFAEREEREEITKKRQGFGLWWVKTFLTDIGAQLELFESELDKGTTFVVRLPPTIGQ